MNSKEVKTSYFIKKIINMVNVKGNGIVFDFTVGGLLELSRQFIEMPNEIKKLSAPKLITSICNYIDTSSFTNANNADLIINKYVRQLEVRMRLLRQTKEGSHIPSLFNLLSKKEFALGCIKNIDKLINNSEQELTQLKELEFKFITELTHFLIDYLIYIGYSREELFSTLNNFYIMYTREEIELDKCYSKIKSTLLDKVSSSIENLEVKQYSIRIKKEELDNHSKHKVLSYFGKILNELIEENRLKEYTYRETTSNMILDLYVYVLDRISTNNLLKFIVGKFETLKRRVKFIPENLTIQIRSGNKKVNIEESKSTNKLNLKYFDELWNKSNWKKTPSSVYKEILRIDEWVNIIEESNEKRLSFLTLWSTLEFILIGDREGDKRQILYENFIPYMGLYFFRKNLKVLFRNIAKDRIMSSPEEFEQSCKEIRDFILSKLPNTNSIKINEETVANKFLIFLIANTFDKRWEGFNFGEAIDYYYIAESELLISDLNTQIEFFEKIIEIDIDQMYRLRNMLTHGGLNDKKILDNTYNRLQYYVQTLINSISYTWINSPDSISNLEELHHLKKYDYDHYKKRIKKITQNRNNYKGWLKLVELGADEFFVSVPKNKFKSYGVE